MRAFGPIVFANVLTLLAAQQSPGTQPAQERPILVDTVVATVNDAAILLSSIRTLSDGRAKAASQEMGRPLMEAEVRLLYRNFLQNEINRHALAQSAKSFGVATPEIVEQIVADELKRDEEEQVRDLGTWQEYSRELQRQGRTWQTYRREQRVEKLFQLAQSFAINMRMQKQRNLFLTPRMLRETYRRNRDLFVHGARADLGIVLFTGPDAEAKAASAAATWALRELSPQQLAATITNATPLPIQRDVFEGSRNKGMSGELVDCALAGPKGQVSAPIQVGSGFHVAKVMAYTPARDGSFADRNVQLQLREICLKSVIQEFEKQALERAADRTEVWKSPQLR